MKYLLLFLLMPAISFSQTYPEGALGVKYKQSITEVSQIMKARGGKLVAGESTRDQLVFKGLKYGSFDSDLVLFNFFEGQLISIGIFIEPAHHANAIELYKRVCNNLEEKYGEPGEIIEDYKYPYEKGDGHEETAISLGKAIFKTRWYFEYKDTRPDMIIVSITDKFDTLILYADGEGSKKNHEKKSAKESLDY